MYYFSNIWHFVQSNRIVTSRNPIGLWQVAQQVRFGKDNKGKTPLGCDLLHWSGQVKRAKKEHPCWLGPEGTKGVLESWCREDNSPLASQHMQVYTVILQLATTNGWSQTTKLTRQNRLQHISPDQLQTRFTDYGAQIETLPSCGHYTVDQLKQISLVVGLD